MELHLVSVIMFFLVAWVAGGCTLSAPPENETLRASLIGAVNGAKSGEVIDLTNSLGTSWDRVAFMPPYSTNADARDALGFPFDIEASPTYADDNGTVVVLAKDQRLVGWFVLYWRDVDNSMTAPTVVPASDAKMIVTVSPDGYRHIELTGGP